MTTAPARPRLTRDGVLRAALDYVDRHGLAALSMHKLGAELGVKGMSLYNHVGSKDDLLDGIVETLYRELDPPPADSTDWQQALRDCASSLRDLLRRHPAAALLMCSRPVMPTRSLEVHSAYLDTLLRAGFGRERALDALRTVVVYAQGYALAETTWRCANAAEPDTEIGRLRQVADMVPRDAPDHLLAFALQFCGGNDYAAQFNLGIDLMIRGLGNPAGSLP